MNVQGIVRNVLSRIEKSFELLAERSVQRLRDELDVHTDKPAPPGKPPHKESGGLLEEISSSVEVSHNKRFISSSLLWIPRIRYCR